MSHEIEMLRSDKGDGGWSLGFGEGEDYVCVLSGPADWNAETREWSRPSAEDLRAGADLAEQGSGCLSCELAAESRKCHECGASAMVVDCGCQLQPRPIAADDRAPYEHVCDHCVEHRTEPHESERVHACPECYVEHDGCSDPDHCDHACEPLECGCSGDRSTADGPCYGAGCASSSDAEIPQCEYCGCAMAADDKAGA